MTAFAGMTPRESPDHFHQRCVVPSSEETRERNRVIDQFVRFLHSRFNTSPNKVAEVLKSGSLGKGTAARGSADIDLVVILNGLHDVLDLKNKREHLLTTLKQCVDSHEGWGPDRPKLVGETSFSLQYLLHGQDMDILPALNIDSVYGPLDAVYQKMNDLPPKERNTMVQDISASLARWQIDFVKPEGEAVKKVIRLLKYWKHEKGLKIRSYTLELLTIYTQRTVQWKDTSTLLRNVLSRLADCRNIRVAFDKHYSSAQYTRYHSAPYVLDPANPYMNTMYRMKEEVIADVSREASRMLDRL